MNHLNLTIKLHALRNKDVPCRFVQYVRTYVHVEDIHITNRRVLMHDAMPTLPEHARV